jgi:hypothetical protein
VLHEIFERDHPVRHVASHDPGGRPKPAERPIAGPDDEADLERLRALGYVE